MAEIQSKNCVGYQVNAIPEDQYSTDIGVVFSNLGSTSGKYTITTEKVFDTAINNGDVLLIFNPNAYNYDWYEFMASYKGAPTWSIQDMQTGEYTYVESFEVNEGDNIVFMPMNGDTDLAVGISGEVADLKGASRVFDIDAASDDANDYMFPIANPFPVDTTKKMLDDFIANGDVILVWNDTAYNYDWYEFMENYKGAPTWSIQNMETGEYTYKTEDDDVIIPAGHGGVFVPYDDGVRTWTVSLEK